MARLLSLAQLVPASLAGLVACAPAEGAGTQDVGAVVYGGVETRLLDSDLVNLHLSVQGGQDDTAVTAYAGCAVAQFALDHGFGFVRHVRTTIEKKGDIRRADAVYTLSPALPRGLRTIDAEVTVADCADQGIPTV
ncbi:MAG: hypothetical protein KDJ82_06170 [Rhodobacteraceae bacterium]|jgi:hypothetical protein|nr:hypothetical protein [Paracoccaceae bacterium]